MMEKLQEQNPKISLRTIPLSVCPYVELEEGDDHQSERIAGQPSGVNCT